MKNFLNYTPTDIIIEEEHEPTNKSRSKSEIHTSSGEKVDSGDGSKGPTKPIYEEDEESEQVETQEKQSQQENTNKTSSKSKLKSGYLSMSQDNNSKRTSKTKQGENPRDKIEVLLSEDFNSDSSEDRS
jgi:hypothetical protein